jgi:hypothetical protein
MLVEFRTLEQPFKSFGSFSKDWLESERVMVFESVRICELWQKILVRCIYSVCKMCVKNRETIG